MLQVACCCVAAVNEAQSWIACTNLLVLFNLQILLKYRESRIIQFVEMQCVWNVRAVSLDVMKTPLIFFFEEPNNSNGKIEKKGKST